MVPGRTGHPSPGQARLAHGAWLAGQASPGRARPADGAGPGLPMMAPGRTALSLPVFVLEWPPSSHAPDVVPGWRSIACGGALGLLGRLCSGQLTPLDGELELTACFTDGRWFGALQPAEPNKLAALVAFQALRLDSVISARCRLVPAPPGLNASLPTPNPNKQDPNTCIYMHMHVYIYIYAYVSLSVYIYIYA